MRDHRKAGGRRAGHGIAVLSLVGAAALLFAPVALAGTLKTATKTVNISGVAASGTVRVACPSGTRAFAGGFKTSPPTVTPPAAPNLNPTAQDLLVVNESRQSGSKAWRASASQLGTGSGTLTAFAYCHPAKVKQVLKATPLAATGRAEASSNAACPKGKVVVSGGYALPAATSQGQFAFATQNVLAGPRKWNVHGVRGRESAPSAGTVTSYAYCAAGKALTQLLKTISGVTSLTTSPPLSAQAGPCAKGVVSGGFKAPYTQNSSTRETIFVTESLLTKTGWRVTGQPFGNTGLQLNLSAFAYCK